MKTTTLAPIIKEHAFFAGFDDATIDFVTGCAKNVRFEDGDDLARQGDPADQFYLIREGRVAISFPAPQGGNITIETVDEDDIVGWSWLMPPYEWQFDVTAVQPVRAIAMDGKCLRGKCEENHELGYMLLKRFAGIMAQRLEAARLQLLDIYGVHS